MGLSWNGTTDKREKERTERKTDHSRGGEAEREWPV
jgi:hypothetical protein